MARWRRIVALGGGAWGTALANLAARAGAEDVALWTRDAAHVAEMTATGVNARRLPGIPLHSALRPTTDLGVVAEADLILAVVPSQSLRGVLEQIQSTLPTPTPLILCCKGIEHETGLFMSEVAADVLGDQPVAVLSGPSFAEDVARGKPTAVTLAAYDGALAAALVEALAAPWFRLYHTHDVRGVEIGGAAKNVLAIANGIAAGRDLGASAGAALIARGFAELCRFGRAFGVEMGTLAGLSGLGDLVLTCGSAQSRNYSFGHALGRGTSINDARANIGLVEGFFTCGILNDLARAKGVDMPIAQAVEAVLAERMGVDEAIATLLARPSKAELAGF
ncbi:NAD(P)H-dependent glycerol-3-phosphate dehydrogenase [Beijerinckia indica]|uniref:Glycerol-3-phosphate dehydrogenase [NAD(P)+] n=1 Tax=Beijerinckia indica subsp. indica (strain ATCC 9039 / DSM 1715 / NCIMB 8712) TaxID=395963 RepID=GPDA_BEII9|nr:NAD(P)H-dependent glycerol-3-phosphate dehydrogenase [Beijerinckia indica]B2ID14.1 RecName: Full=Glycerol-3-phosphate dehydrogenase [NAD(P)+]; AltName: Full=NAD(P)H-dependent glycerol-3-phosphate dehydrogenase [Beijerinckia indica subsp. indica ATCC 9039]ACB96779.1 Glycerol-3-phosphate dehydrogenase (NAD(P)(+)) [Beijerinckia indica subsp. indica ATCC 9039]